MKTLAAAFAVLLLPCSSVVRAQAPPATVTRNITAGSTTLTVNFALHPIRSVNYNIRVQDSTGAFTAYTADVPRTYIGTVVGRPGAIAAGYQKANGTFLSFISFEDGASWNGTNNTASAASATWTPVFPTTGVGAGGAGSNVYAAELGIDASYREWQAVGANLVNAIDMIEWCTMKADVIYLRDAGILHRLGRIVIRTDPAKCPYQALASATTDDWSVLLNTMKTQWNTVLPPVLGSSAHDVASLVRPGVGGGLAFVGAIGSANRYSITGATSAGDFVSAWRHELGHNWGSSHFEGGGKPEGPTIMSDNKLARFSSSELAKIIPHRNSKTSILDNLGAYPFPLPPRVFQDRVTMTAGTSSSTIDVLANDSDGNGQALSLLSFDGSSASKALIVRSAGTGPGGRDQLTYYAPPNYSSGFDHFNYRIQDSAGFQAVGKVYVNPVKLPPLPPLWASADIGGVGAAGDAGGIGASVIAYGAGADIWGTADEFRYVHQAASGDCDFRARVTAQANTNGFAKSGVMLRNGTAADAAHVSLYVTPSNGFAFQYRSAAGGTTSNVAAPALNTAPNNWVRITRTGNLFTGYVSADGATWTQVATATVTMGSSIRAGLAVCSHVDVTPGGAIFDSISLADSTSFLALLSDGFDSASATAANDASDPMDTAWSIGTMSLASDPTLGTGQALNVSGGSFLSATGPFAGRSLAAVGDTLRLSFDFRYTEAPANTSAGFRFGLYNAAGAGYCVHHGTGGNGGYAVMECPTGTFGSGSVSAVTSGSKATINDQAKHALAILLRRTATGVSISATVDGVTLTGTDTTPVITAFDTVFVSNGSNGADYRLDNIRVESSHLVAPLWTANPFTKPTAATGAAYTGTLTGDVATPHPGHTYSKVSGPAWLTIASSGALSGTPAAGDLGANAFVVRVTNELGQSADATMNLAVAANTVAIAATDATASEDDLSTGTFTITRAGSTADALVVAIVAGGTAQSGADYLPLGNTVTIPAGQSSVPLIVTPLDDTRLEPSETVILTLQPSDDYALGTASATVTIADDESLLVRVNDGFDSATATVGNDGDDPFDIAWTGTSATLSLAADTTFNTGKALNVDCTGSYGGVRGAFAARSLPANGDALTLSFDFRYTAAPTNTAGGLRFGLYNAAGAGFCTQHGTGGNGSYSILECPTGAFGAGSGLTTLGSGSKTSISDQLKHTCLLTVRKTATGVSVTTTIDGVSLTGTDTTPVITTFDTISVTNGNQIIDFRLDNVRVEYLPNHTPGFASNPLAKSAVVNTAYAGSLAGDAVDSDPASTITFSKVSGPAWLSVAANGALTGTPTNAQSGSNSFVVRATDNYGVATDVTLLVHVGYPVTVTAPQNLVQEQGGPPGVFLITRGGPTTSALTVRFHFDGTATAGEDYIAPPLTAVIPAGQTSVSVPVASIDDDLSDEDETIVLVLDHDPAYAVSTPASATVTIIDNEIAVLADDTFDIGTPATPADDAADPTDIPWTSSGGTLSVGNDDAFGFGNSLQLDATGTFSAIYGDIPSRSLSNVDDTLTFSFDFRYSEMPASTGSGLRIGLFNAVGDGFLIQQGIGGAGGWALAEDIAGDNGFGSGGTVSGLTSAGRASINDLEPHTIRITLVRTAAGMRISGFIDGSTITFEDTTPVVTAFSRIVIRHGSLNAGFNIDNVRLEFSRNHAPVFVANPLAKSGASAGVAYEESLEEDILDANAEDSATFSKISGPAWLVVGSDGSLGGTPAAGDAGLNSFVIRVSDSGGLSGDTTMSVNVTNSPLEAWRVQRFGAEASNPAIAGNEADPDADGRSNLLEFALNGDPASAVSRGRDFALLRQIGADSVFTYTLAIREDAAFAADGNRFVFTTAGVVYTLEATLDPGNWANPQALQEVTPALISGFPAPDSGWQYRTFRLATPPQSKAFMRVRVSAP